ncbi:trypsin-like serine protease [Magnetospira sp. QH-2]|uniref:trypsin-like serine protease n=1 Tax=Magnetospira sp. (strain QH-2) TaxID=1288970 RepID=UPI0006980957|nr:trypsin-like serine protease [Magnetospira sp. QH-2]
MMFRVLILVVTLFAPSVVLAGNPLLPGIKGADDRVYPPGGEYPWSAIGRLNKRTGGFCTGVLVGPKTVLTAAHCLWNQRTLSYLPTQSLHFLAGYSRGDYIAHAKVTGINVPKGYNYKDKNTWRKTGRDWALVTLAKDLSNEAGFLGVESLDRARFEELRKNKAVFIQAGYSQDKAHVLSVHLACRMVGFSFGRPILHHQCDAVHGDSGSPVFLFDGQRFRVAAIHVATLKPKKGESVGLAVPGKTFANSVRSRAAHGSPPGRPQAEETAKLLLAKLGHPVHGDLAAAVRAFQSRERIKATGKVDYALIGRMITRLKQTP